MKPRSSLYVGSIMHRRLLPRRHDFSYRAFWMLLDLDELESLSGKLRFFSYNRSNIFSFHDADHGDGSQTPVRLQIEQKLREAAIDPTGGRIELLCMPRTLGYSFNPLSIFFCRNAAGRLAAIVYQVHNTFSQRHSYVIAVDDPDGTLRQECQKTFYVSPFLDMDLKYDFRIVGPGERVSIGIRASRDSKTFLSAVLHGRQRELTDRALLGLFLRMPAITTKVIAAIHLEGAKLWLKGIALRHRPEASNRTTSVVEGMKAAD